MVEYISREAAKEKCCSLCRWEGTDNCSECEHPIDDIPAADVREVVRCRDCRNDCHCLIQDFMEDYGITPDARNNFFCGYGEREES